MNKIVISVESTCDLSEEWVKKSGVSVINMEYSIDGTVYVAGDGSHTSKSFYDKMREGAVTKTALINEYDAENYLSGILETGADVIHLGFSSSLSGTYQSFAAAEEKLKRKYPERKIAVIDSLCASSGQGYYATMVSQYSKEHTFEQTVEYAESLKHRIVHLFVVDDLKYLARGGRISKATALLGNTIHMKPVMHMNKEGALVAYKKVISRKKSLLEVSNRAAHVYNGEGGRIFVAHADCIDEARLVAERLEKDTGVKPDIMDLGMVIGSHSGPGTLAIFLTASERD